MKAFGFLSGLLFSVALQAATVVTVDGKLEGKFVSLTGAELVIGAGKKRSAIPLTKIIRAELAPVSANRSPVRVGFSDGGVVRAAAAVLAGTTVKVRSAFFESSFPADELSFISFSDLSGKELENARSARHDVVFLATPSGKLDRIRGLIDSVGEKEIKLETDRGAFAIAKSKVKAIAFVRLAARRRAQHPLLITLRDGTRLRGSLAGAAKGVEIVRGACKIAVGFETIARIENISLGLTRLEEMQFKSTRGRVWPVFPMEPARNKSLWGGVLSLGGRRFERGLSAQSATELTFALDGAYDRFVATAGIDDEVRAPGTAAITVLVDSKKAAELKLRAGSSVQIRAPLARGKLLTIKIQDGGDGNLGDHVDFVDCVLVKK